MRTWGVSGRALAAQARISEKHLSLMLNCRAEGSLVVWDRLLMLVDEGMVPDGRVGHNAPSQPLPVPTPEKGAAMAVKARFYVSQVTSFAYNKEQVAVVLQAVARGEENRDWAAATPSGNIQMTVNNPTAATWFKDRLGAEVSILFADS